MQCAGLDEEVASMRSAELRLRQEMASVEQKWQDVVGLMQVRARRGSERARQRARCQSPRAGAARIARGGHRGARPRPRAARSSSQPPRCPCAVQAEIKTLQRKVASLPKSVVERFEQGAAIRAAIGDGS
jgi:hypothetical protein